MKLSEMHDRFMQWLNDMTKEDCISFANKAKEDSCDSYLMEDDDPIDEQLDYIRMILDRMLVNANGILRDINEQDKIYIQASSIIGLITNIKTVIK